MKNTKEYPTKMAKRRYILELTENQIGILSMSLEYQQQMAEENRSYNTQRKIDNMQKLYDLISDVRQNGMKTIRETIK